MARGKGKKPLGNEGKRKDDETDAPAVLGDAESVVIEIAVDDSDVIDALEPIHIGSRVPQAYEMLKTIMRERKQSVPLALASNVKRKFVTLRRGLFAGVCTIIGGVISTALVGDPFSGFAAGAAIGTAAPAAAETAKIRLSKRAALRRDYPDTPEFNDDWAVCCYEFMLIVHGYNLRVEAIRRMLEVADEVESKRAVAILRVADEMREMLLDVRDDLLEVARVLEQYQPDTVETVIATEESIAAIRLINPLKDGLYDWLILDPELIPVGREPEQLEHDKREIAAFKEVRDAIDPYEAMRREQEDDEDSDR